MFYRLFLFATSLTFTGIAPSFAAKHEAAKTAISWGLPSGSNKLQKVEKSLQHFDYIAELLEKNLPEYEHSHFNANVQRILMQIKSTDNTCFASCLEDRKRLDYLYWTSYGVLPPPILVVRAAVAKDIKSKNGEVSLLEVVKNQKLKGAAGTARSYGPELDKIFHDLKGGNFQRGAFDFYSENLMEMISKGRLDYTIEHRFVFEKLTDQNRRDYETFAIKEAEKPLTTYIACSRSPFGKIVIEKIDKIIRKNVESKVYWDEVLTSWSNSLKDAEFSTVLKSFAQERAKKTVIE